jgi:protein SCO1/2
MHKISSLLFASIIGLMTFISCTPNEKQLAYVGVKVETDIDDNGNVIMDTVRHRVPEFSFINQNGKTITHKDFEGSIYVVDFFFTTCPTICKDMTGNMIELQKMTKGMENLRFLSHSVNPEYDTPEVLMNYAKSYGADLSNWDFVTGEKSAIYTQGLKGYFVEAEEAELAPGGFLHSEFFVLVDKKGHIRSRKDKHGNIKAMYDGTNAEDVKMLYQDIKTLQKEE